MNDRLLTPSDSTRPSGEPKTIADSKREVSDKNSFHGLIAAAHTPMNADRSLNLQMIERQAEHFLESGVSGVFVAGTTGECHSLSVDERLALAERWARVAAGTSLRLFIHVGHNCQSDAIALAEQASRLPVDAIAAMAPSFFKPQTIPELLDFLAPVANAALRLPFFYYDIPALTGVHLQMVELLEKGPACISNLAGIKYTNLDLAQFQECTQYNGGEFNIMFGCDESLVAGLTLGTQAAVGSSFNFAMPLYNRIIESFRNGDSELARTLQVNSVKMINALAEYGYSAAAKAVMKMIDVDCGPARSPLQNLTEQQESELHQRLDELEVLR